MAGGASHVRGVLADLRVIAARRAWADLATEAPDLGERALLVCAAPGAAVTALTAWLGEQAPGDPVRVTALADLAGDPLTALHANRVLVAFDCAELLSADAIAAAAELIARPAGTVRVIVTGAAMAGEADLALVQRRVWRTLYGARGRDWAGEDLGPLGCVLWDAGRPSDAVAGRLERDAAGLAEWLHEPVGPDAALTRYRAERLLDLAAARADRDDRRAQAAARRQPTAPSMQVPAQAAEIRDRLLSLIEKEADEAGAYLATALDALETDLVVGMPRYVNAHLAEMTDQADKNPLLAGYIARTTASWATEIGANLRLRAAKINLAEQEATAEVAALSPAGPPAQQLQLVLPTVTMDPAALALGGSNAAPATSGRAGAQMALPLGLSLAGFVIGAVASGGLATPVTGSTGAAVGAGVGGALGAYAQKRRADQQRERTVAFGRRCVDEHLAHLRGTVPSGLRAELGALRSAVESAFSQLDVESYAAQAEPGAAGSPPADGDSAGITAELTALRARLTELPTD